MKYLLILISILFLTGCGFTFSFGGDKGYDGPLLDEHGQHIEKPSY